MLGTALGDADTPDSSKSKYIGTSPVEKAGQDVVLTMTARVQNNNIVPEASSLGDPAVTVSSILPSGSDSWPSVSELTTFSATTGTPTLKDISAPEAGPISTSQLDITSSYHPSPTPSTTPPKSNPSSLASTQTASSTAITSASSTTSATSDSTAFSGSPSKTTKIAIAVPVSIIGLALILALIFFLARRRRRQKERNTLPPSYDIATGHRSAVSTQELMISPKSSTPEPRRSFSTPVMSSPAMSMPMPIPRIPIISISPSTESRGRTPSPGASSGASVRRMSMDHGPGDSVAELGVAVAVPMDQRRSATEQDFRGRVASAASSRGPSRLTRMPFEDFSDDEVGIGIARGGSDDGYDDAVSDVSDLDGRRRERDFDEHSVVSSFDEVSPIGEQERRRFRGV
ncbi:hypothetical protein N7491_004385 [Penicillium cf. griseofulvum]|uniref:Uncharacterized protein n=1 Tax=Penicillium cf. griseofulvum TaxID=2972120 RepID=A0A9W9J2I7_9EURO|nr:hypothetical protein N7472_007075 [Penicillium cf. griseofulvum]KAJ5422993.1 hypothetical protein N7445_011101 [Penicillium cf. griseofulvum]KAJ5433790.1 hypothetical protein N7491_004385 [Penicillium cf. griseofulvum]